MGFHDSRGSYHEFLNQVPIPLHLLRLSDANGDVGNTVANGGILASDTVPIMRGAAGLIAQEISWVASNSQPLVAPLSLPMDFDGRSDVTIELWVNSGTTDAATFAVGTSWDGGATVTDTATDGAKSATTHKITAAIAAADIPDSPAFVTLLLTPAAHTTNTIQLLNARLLYTPRNTA